MLNFGASKPRVRGGGPGPRGPPPGSAPAFTQTEFDMRRNVSVVRGQEAACERRPKGKESTTPRQERVRGRERRGQPPEARSEGWGDAETRVAMPRILYKLLGHACLHCGPRNTVKLCL